MFITQLLEVDSHLERENQAFDNNKHSICKKIKWST